MQIGANYKTINDHLTKKYSNRKSTSFNKLINQSDTVMLNGGNNAKNILSKVRKTTAFGKKDTYIFGITSFNLNNFDNLIKIIKELYDKNLDINMVFYNMTAGNINLERPFGSISNNGHYVSLLVNVQEFVENNTLYFIDSLPRNIKNEHNCSFVIFKYTPGKTDDPALIDYCHKRWMKVCYFNIVDKEETKRLKSIGADMLILNKPVFAE